MVPLYKRPYTNDELEVFRLCNKLKEDGCKNNTEAEKKICILMWHMTPSSIQTLVKQWFYNREKIDLLLAEVDVETETTKNDGLATKSTDSTFTN
jgi:hypothetical protein